MKHNLIAYKVDKLSVSKLRIFVKSFFKTSIYKPYTEVWYILYDIDCKDFTKHLMKTPFYNTKERADERLNQLKDEENIINILDAERMLI